MHRPLYLDGIGIQQLGSSGSSRKSHPPHPPGKVDLLPDEVLTAKVLNEIFPRTPRKDSPSKGDDSDTLVSPGSPNKVSPGSISITLSPDDGPFIGSKYSTDDAKKTQKLTRFKTQNLGASMDSAAFSASQLLEPKSPANVKSPLAPKTPVATFKADAPPAQSTHATTGRTPGVPLTPLQAMMDFRAVLIERYHSMEDGVKLLTSELDDPRWITKKDFRRFLQKISLDLSKEERDGVFKFLDVDANGRVTMQELELSIASAAPVRTLMDLRRRWLAAGIPCMETVMRNIHDAGIHTRNPLTLREFGEALSQVFVTDHEEHLTLFNMVVDPSDPHSRVSISELLAAVATLSPSGILEDFRHHLSRKYGGDFEKAFTDIDVNRKGIVRETVFKSQATKRYHMTEYQAAKMFRHIDVDDTGWFSKKDFLSAIALSEPSLFLEELRRKVLQRFRSIHVAFQNACANEPSREGEKNVTYTLDRFQEILRPVEFTEGEVEKLFDLIDVTRKDKLTVAEFVKGTLQFAPSWAFEDLHLACSYRNKYIFETFLDAEVERREQLDLPAFTQLLEDFDLDTDLKIPIIFDILDLQHEGYVTLGLLIAALQAGGPGTAVKLSEEETDTKAKQDVHGCISSVQKLVGDLKSHVRQGAHEDILPSKELPLAKGNEAQAARGRMKRTGGHRGSMPKQTNHLGEGSDTSGNVGSARPGIMSPRSTRAARLRTYPHDDIKFYILHQAECPTAGTPKAPPNPREEVKTASHVKTADNQQSWNHVWRRLNKASSPEDRQRLEKDVQDYYQDAMMSLSHDVPLLDKAHSRYALHRKVGRHNAALEADKDKQRNGQRTSMEAQ
jgi:Ca2+-binding EF-hand superfamily protein